MSSPPMFSDHEDVASVGDDDDMELKLIGTYDERGSKSGDSDESGSKSEGNTSSDEDSNIQCGQKMYYGSPSGSSSRPGGKVYNEIGKQMMADLGIKDIESETEDDPGDGEKGKDDEPKNTFKDDSDKRKKVENEASGKNEGDKGKKIVENEAGGRKERMISLIKDIGCKEDSIQKLKEDNKKSDEELKDAKETAKKQQSRIDEMKKRLDRQEKDIEQQQKQMKEDKEIIGEVGRDRMTALEKGLDLALHMIAELKRNIDRVVGGASVLPKSETMRKLRDGREKLTFFCPGLLEEMPVEVQEELKKVDNIKMIGYEKSGGMGMVQKVMNYAQGEFEETGVVVLNLEPSLCSNIESIRKRNIEQYTGFLNIITPGEGKVFKKLVFVIPPSNGKDLSALETLASKVEAMKCDDIEIVNLLRSQMEMGLKNKGKNEDVWRGKVATLARSFCKMEDEKADDNKIGLNSYSLYRMMSEIATRSGDNAPGICDTCAHIHEVESCGVERK